MSPRWFVWLSLIILAGTTHWWLQRLQDAIEPPATLPAARSDYSLEVFDLMVMNLAGEPSFRVEAPYLEKQPSDNAIVLEQPKVQLFEGGQPDWRAVSESAWISADGQELLLNGLVVLNRSRADKQTITIRTSKLVINPDTKTAHTDQPVSLSSPGIDLKGIGLRAKLDSERFRILSNVQGRYAPQRSG